MAINDADQALLQQASALCRDPFFRDMVWRHCPNLNDRVASDRLSTVIHPGDQMLLHSLRHHQDANAAFSQYYNVALQQYNAAEQILRAMFPGPAADDVAFLDFACGFGRLLRFMSLRLPAGNVWASEIQPEALAFACDSFGVHGLPSYADPAQFEPGRRFHFIWVASLFSHLPEHLFQAWLGRLMDTLEPDGVLCFSVHDACLLPPGLTLPAGGIRFTASSENPDLDAGSYGTTHVNEAFVGAAIRGVCGADQPYQRIPRGLAHEQDLYVVPRNPQRDLSALSGFRRGPWGWVDERRMLDAGQLYLRGWAASIDDGPLASVGITVNGERFACPTGLLREDVARVFEDARLASAGWAFRHDVAAGDGDEIRVVVTAETAAGEKALLYTGLMQQPLQSAPPMPATVPRWSIQLRQTLRKLWSRGST
ncbi:MAG TPA: class I SAM-dependent methyltransferase [Azoarcus taiwanensis]|nr:class I SAM-dependent methyltransferase [Azoarcus taiwanensis]